MKEGFIVKPKFCLRANVVRKYILNVNPGTGKKHDFFVQMVRIKQ